MEPHPEIVKLLPLDEHLDKIQIQKSATPVEGRYDTASVAEKLGTSIPNAAAMAKKQAKMALTSTLSVLLLCGQ